MMAPMHPLLGAAYSGPTVFERLLQRLEWRPRPLELPPREPDTREGALILRWLAGGVPKWAMLSRVNWFCSCGEKPSHVALVHTTQGELATAAVCPHHAEQIEEFMRKVKR